ncbi:MAG: SIR2 family protein [Fimbriimonadaceae bacterium]
MEQALRSFFEEDIQFRLRDGTEVEGGVFIGSTEFLPVEILRDDPDAFRAEFELWVTEVWQPEQQQKRDEILALHGNEKRYADLRAAAERQQVVPFVGSGMSAPSGLPTWSDLLRRISKFTNCDSATLEQHLGSFQFEEAADLLAASTNPRLLTERVEHDLRVDDSAKVSGPVRLLPALFPNLVITTNLDDVLEHAYRSCERPFAQVLAGGGLAQYRSIKSSSVRLLLKLHGDCRQTSGRVLLSSEYDTTYARGSMIREEITLLYRTHNLLFVGCSLGADRTVRLIEEVAGSDQSMPKHYCFLPMPNNDITRVERENFLTQRGIYPIWYHLPHDESNTALLDGLLSAGSGTVLR